MTLSFDRSFAGAPGEPLALSPRVTRLTAPNFGPFTFKGTNSYVIAALGGGPLAIIDPGPDRDDHLNALLALIDGRPVAHIFVTHTHVDHSTLVPRLKAATGAQVCGCGVHEAARPLADGESNLLDASADRAYAPDRQMQDGDVVEGAGYTVSAVATPGHTMNHLCFALAEERALFSGDHAMAWSTSIVAPPDGQMRAYRASLTRLLTRDDDVYWPGHGGPVTAPKAHVTALSDHRAMRAEQVLAALTEAPQTIMEMVPRLYPDLDKGLYGAAALSVFAHLEEHAEDGCVRAEGPFAFDGRFLRA